MRAGSVSLSRYPLAPARSAANRSSSVSETVNMTTIICGRRAVISQQAAIPLPGILMSSTHKSGRVSYRVADRRRGMSDRGDDREPRVAVEYVAQLLQGGCMVVGQQRPQGCHSCTSTTVPCHRERS